MKMWRTKVHFAQRERLCFTGCRFQQFAVPDPAAFAAPEFPGMVHSISKGPVAKILVPRFHVAVSAVPESLVVGDSQVYCGVSHGSQGCCGGDHNFWDSCGGDNNSPAQVATASEVPAAETAVPGFPGLAACFYGLSTGGLSQFCPVFLTLSSATLLISLTCFHSSDYPHLPNP